MQCKRSINWNYENFDFQSIQVVWLTRRFEIRITISKIYLHCKDFPPKVVDRVFALYKPDQKEENEQFDYTLTVPFIPGFSEDIKRELWKLGVRVAFRKGRTLESILCRLKFREPFEKSKNNIYKRNCKNCNFTYIGETSQYQQCRDRGHKDAIKACDANISFMTIWKETQTTR